MTAAGTPPAAPTSAAPKPQPGRLETLARRAHERVHRLRATARRWEAKAPRAIALVRAVFYPFGLAVVGFIGYRAARQTDLSSVHYWPLLAALGAALVWWLALAFGWAALIGDRAAVVRWCQTQVARYLPGAVWAVVARATTVKGRIRDKATAVTAENVIVFVVALGIGGVWAGLQDWRWLALVPVAAVPLLASRWLARRTKLTRRGIHRSAATYAVGYAAYGATGILVQLAVSGGGSASSAFYVAGAACVAWAVGLVVVFAPSGVGVREVVYVWMLAGILPKHEIEAAAVTMRLVTVLAELAVLAFVSRPRRSRTSVPTAGALGVSSSKGST